MRADYNGTKRVLNISFLDIIGCFITHIHGTIGLLVRKVGYL